MENLPSSENTDTRAADWRRSSTCVPDDLCVEVWYHDDVARVRDAKDPDAPELRFPPCGWRAFLDTPTPRVILL